MQTYSYDKYWTCGRISNLLWILHIRDSDGNWRDEWWQKWWSK